MSPIVGYLLPHLLNVFIDKYKHLESALQRNELDNTLARAVMEDSLILATLSNGKVYCGYVSRSPDPIDGDKTYIEVLPMLSGYRDDYHSVVFTTRYDHIIAQIDSDLEHLEEGNFKVVIPVSEVISIRLFDADAYNKFNPKTDIPNASS